jgi:hypothetical protein
VLPAILISMGRWNEKQNEVNKPKRNEFAGLTMVIGFVIGALIGFWPYKAEANFRSALEEGNANSIYAAGIKWPQDTARMIYTAQIFNHNQMPDKAYAVTKMIVKYNPRSYEAWVYLFNSKSTSASQKREILLKLKNLEPHNPQLAKLG